MTACCFCRGLRLPPSRPCCPRRRPGRGDGCCWWTTIASVLEALRRALSVHFEVEVADGVAAALERVGRAGEELDLVLCDLMMRDGGGARLFSELSRLAPPLAARTLFVTGGATSEDCAELRRGAAGPGAAQAAGRGGAERAGRAGAHVLS